MKFRNPITEAAEYHDNLAASYSQMAASLRLSQFRQSEVKQAEKSEAMHRRFAAAIRAIEKQAQPELLK
jgi:hypothetical protein